jgi:1,4-alpha-glucan branching enzyme
VVVTFRLPEVAGERANVVGEFNGWSPEATPMERRDGSFVTEVELPIGRAYRFRYLLDGERWQNDWAADAYGPNEYGGDDSVIDLTDGIADRPSPRR